MNPVDRKRASHLRNKYGISLEQYASLLSQQGNCCAICRRAAEEFTTRLAVDHDHISGEIRGLLCNYCNRRIVGRHRDADLIQRLADYLRQGTGWFVPKKKKTIKRKKNGNSPSNR